MKAIKVMGKIDERGHLTLDQPLITNINQQVEAIVLIPEILDSDRNDNNVRNTEMQATKDKIKQEIEQFNDEQLQQIADFIEFIKFRSRFSQKSLDLHQFAHFYQEFALEYRELAEAGIADYFEQLKQEDMIQNRA
jgi:hypothetical protein